MVKDVEVHVRSPEDARRLVEALDGYEAKSVYIASAPYYCYQWTPHGLVAEVAPWPRKLIPLSMFLACVARARLRGLRQVFYAYSPRWEEVPGVFAFFYKPWKAAVVADYGYTRIEIGAMEKIYAKLNVDVDQESKTVFIIVNASCNPEK